MSPAASPRVRAVADFAELLATPFAGDVNALCWERTLPGDFAEVIEQLGPGQGIEALADERLTALTLNPAGQRAAAAMLADQALLRAHDLAPSLNCIHDCVRGPNAGLVPTDVTSFHVDSAPVEVDTWLCTYHGACSEGLANEEAQRKVDDPAIRTALLQEYGGPDDAGFAEFLHDHCYDLHYAPKPGARPYPFGRFSLWRIATQWPGSPVLPCIHRAPENHPGAPRLLLIS
ncbi:MAG: DUF1826 domain-containing protein [Verrucomicrobia bacterium]|nr:DUF1826 domain-containing protein [Verrucomicrobiota bacterium]